MLAQVRLVRLGSALFVDFQGDTGDHDFGSPTNFPFPIIPTHTIGRIWIEKDALRIRMFEDDWVKNQLKARKLTLAHANADGSVVLTASTEDLRKFAQIHADDEEVFSRKVDLNRSK